MINYLAFGDVFYLFLDDLLPNVERRCRRVRRIKRSLFSKASLSQSGRHCALGDAEGLPIGAETNKTEFKLVFNRLLYRRPSY